MNRTGASAVMTDYASDTVGRHAKGLKGEERGPKRQAVCLNAGAALYIAGKAASIEEGVKLAESLIDRGAALKKLEEFVEETNK